VSVQERVSVSNPYLDEFLKVMRPATPSRYMFARWVERPGYDILHCEKNGLPYKSAFAVRTELVKRYAWAVPDQQALDAIAALDMPVVEVGAGLGYWRSLLEAMGVEGMAFDQAPGKNDYCDGEPFTQVYPGDHRVLEHFARWHGEHHALMLCWPPPASSTMASDCVEAFKGDTLIYIGESASGCTADHRFFELLTGEAYGAYDDGGDWVDGVDVETCWQKVASVDIPHWPGIHDYLTVWRR
jgi:hypothetical protein